MLIQLTFPINSFKNSGVALEFICKYINFDIEAIRSTGQDFVFWKNREIDEYKISDPASFTFVDELTRYHTEKNRITFRREAPKNVEIIAGSLESKESIKLDTLFNDSVYFNLSTAYLYDFTKAHWQSEEFIQNYETAKRPYQHLSIIEKPNMPPILAK